MRGPVGPGRLYRLRTHGKFFDWQHFADAAAAPDRIAQRHDRAWRNGAFSIPVRSVADGSASAIEIGLPLSHHAWRQLGRTDLRQLQSHKRPEQQLVISIFKQRADQKLPDNQDTSVLVAVRAEKVHHVQVAQQRFDFYNPAYVLK